MSGVKCHQASNVHFFGVECPNRFGVKSHLAPKAFLKMSLAIISNNSNKKYQTSNVRVSSNVLSSKMNQPFLLGFESNMRTFIIKLNLLKKQD